MKLDGYLGNNTMQCKVLWLKTQNKLELNIGTWKFRSLYRAGALEMFLTHLSVYKADIVALQEY